MEKTKKLVTKNLPTKKISWQKNILYGAGLASLVAIPITTTLTSSLNSSFISENSQKLDQNLSVTVENQDASAFSSDVKPLVPSYINYVNRLVSTSVGPIVHYNNTIVSLDWFGAERWSLDTKTVAPNNGNGLNATWNRAWLNMSLDRENNHIWMLTNGSGTYKQKLIQIDVVTGKVLGQFTLTNSSSAIFYNITFLASGKVMIYDDRSRQFTPNYILFDPATSKFTALTGNIGNRTMVSPPAAFPNSFMFFANVVPISTNRNIVMVMNFPNVSTSGDAGSNYATCDIYFILADDNLNRVATSGYWSSGQIAVNGLPGYRNTKIWPSLDYYRLLDGRTVCMIYNSLVIINPNDSAASSQNNISFKTYSMGNQWITSWSFDTNESLYFKFQDDPKINRIVSLKTDNISISTYYDLSSSPIESVKQHANSFVIYAVHGYAGSIMLINSFFSETIGPNVWPTQEQIDLNLYGLSLGVVQNTSNPEFGDTKGLLNTANAFQFSADFTIDSSVLNTKLPSEITSNDLTLLNQGFLTQNVSKNPDGTLKYPPFTKTNINDETKVFTVEVYLDQIPWFTHTLPINAIPLKVTRTFDTINGIYSRISWKDASTDYDFINTLPTKVDATDLKRFDPFLIDLSSQVVVDGNGSQLYPKKEYTTTTKDDATGQVTIECTYSYMPLGVAIETKNALSYSFSETFNIFKSSDPKVFNWNTDGAGNSTTSTISNIPSLKKLTEANVLPSSIKANDQNQLLEFINRNTSTGYPISKMRATITPNDNTGTLSITVTLPASYYGTEQTFTHLYTGLNRLNNYTFNYSLPTGLTNLSTSLPTTENTSASLDYTKVLPSLVGEEQIFADFVRYGGYNSLDLVTTLVPNDSSGTLTVQFELTNNYPSSVATINTFSLVNGKTISTITIGNFLTTSEFQSQYVVNFKNNNDLSLNAIKNMEVNTIVTKLNESAGLTVEGKTYHSKEELVELFIASKGVSIPTIAASNVSMYTDNESGLLTFELLFPSSETGLNYPLSFTQTFSGFIQGVAVPTSDIFIFKNQNALDANLLAKLPSAIANELKVNPTLIKDYFVQTLAGEFVSLINNQANFTIETFANDLTGTLGISIEFKNVTNSQTLKLYSKSYVGFSTV